MSTMAGNPPLLSTGLRRQVDGLSAKLSDVVDNLPNKVDLATLVQETTSSRTQQVHVMRDVMAEEVAKRDVTAATTRFSVA